MTFEEIASHAFILIVAGSETTATLLTAATYFLATNQGSLVKLTEEIRSSFKTEDQIDMTSVQNLSYLLAVLDESMRLYPPAPASSPRMAREGGDTILGRYIPEGVSPRPDGLWFMVSFGISLTCAFGSKDCSGRLAVGRVQQPRPLHDTRRLCS